MSLQAASPGKPAAARRRLGTSPIAIPPKRVITFSSQMGTLLGAGITLVRGLAILAEQTEHEKFREVISAIRRDVEAGAKFSEALKRYPRSFPELYVNSVAAGEESGGLERVLMRLAETMRRSEKILSDMKAAMRYPTLVSVMIVGAILFLTMFVVPRFKNVYARFGSDLPLPTQVLISANWFLLNAWTFYVPLGLVLFFTFRWYISTPAGRMQWDLFKLNVPIFGPLVRKMVISRFAFFLLFLYRSGLPITRSLDVVSRACGNAAVGKEVTALRKGIEAGQGLSGPMAKAKHFPPMVRHMVSVGEQSGKLPEMLESLVSYYEEEVSETIAAMNSLIEPLLTFVLGFVVLGLALAIFLPMWNLSRVIQQ